MSEAAAPDETYELTCPHCKRAFTGDLLPGAAARYNGFKCPHCRLFVPLERVDDSPEPTP